MFDNLACGQDIRRTIGPRMTKLSNRNHQDNVSTLSHVGGRDFIFKLTSGHYVCRFCLLTRFQETFGPRLTKLTHRNPLDNILMISSFRGHFHGCQRSCIKFQHVDKIFKKVKLIFLILKYHKFSMHWYWQWDVVFD